jgi:hypothetical protein
MITINGICVFRDGVKPIWEDPVNQKGGEFSTTLRKCSKERMKKYWNKLVLKTIGCEFKKAENAYILA